MQSVDDSVVSGLYALSTRSFVINLLLATLVSIALYPVLHAKILIWFGILSCVVIFRLYNTYRFNTNPNQSTMESWYRTFWISAIITAIIYSSLGFLLIHDLEPYYQLFIITILLGLSSGSAFALSLDTRLSILYMGILLVPLIMTIIFISDLPLKDILAMALFVYLVAQMTIIYKIYKQKIQIDTLSSKHQLMHNVFKDAPIGIFTFDDNYTILDCNIKLTEVLQNEVKNIIGTNLMTLPDSRPIKMFISALEEGSGSYLGAYNSIHGEKLWVDVKSFSYQTAGTKTGIGMIEDKTKEHHATEALEYMAEHDMLTGLLNRRGFTTYIEKHVTNAHHQEYYSILFYLDLNQFKGINDSLGHAVGDNVLLAVSKRLGDILDSTCVISRLGGDEFIVIVPYISKEKDATNLKAEKYAKLIQSIFLDEFVIKQMHLYLQASIGIVLVEPKYHDTEELLRYADLTMYQAKNTSNHIAYYDSSLDEKQKDLFLLQHNLANAIKDNQFKLFFQPIVKMKDESLHSAELLIRWEHPTRGLLSPEEFIPLAKKAGLLSKITWWLIDNVCQQIVQWKNDNQWKLEYISININPEQLLENHFAIEFFKKLKFYGIQTSEVMIEITERSLIDNFTSTQGVINDLKSHGVKCAIDDFGIGYSSLSYLKKLSFHTLKIDRTFVKDIGQNPKEIVLMHTILDIGRQFGYNIIIEGIENDQQKQALLELDEELSYQGYFYSKPANATEFTKKFLT